MTTVTMLSLLGTGANSFGYDLANLFQQGDIWGATPVDFFSAVNTQGRPPSFDWAGQSDKKRARYPAYKNSPEVTLQKMKLWDAVAIFENEKLVRIECSLYNKGDAEVSSRQGAGVIRNNRQFVSRLKKYAERLDKWIGKRGENLEPKRLTTSGIKMMRRVWVKKPYLIELRWAFTESGNGFLGEYINVVFTPYTKEKDPTVAHVSSVHDRYKGWAQDKDFSKNVKTKTNFQGDKYIDNIPMVNQGEKGYCVVAALERMLRYYGAEIDKHALAQLGQSSGARGTVMGKMLATLEKADTKLGIRVKLEYNIAEDLRDYERLMDKYNRQADRMDKPEIGKNQWVIRRTYHIQKLFSLFDREVFCKVRKEAFYHDRKNFIRTVKDEVKEGRPVLWSVWLGIVPEPGVKLQGGVSGHARLIIGYNDKKKQILYSDTWGKGHELKRMPIDDAWAITTLLTTVKPRRRQY
ncbi:MAG: C39 family peptidase [Lentisphaeria bacterium]